MNTYEEKGCLTYKDRDGNLYRLYPATKMECVEGTDFIYKHIANKENPHGATAEQVGAIPIEYIADNNEVVAYLGM